MPPHAEESQVPPSPTVVRQEREPTTNGDDQIAQVLFLDIVGFTKLRPAKQRSVLAKLQGIVRQTKDFCAAKTANELIALPTGDGMALVFLTTKGGSGAAISCAETIADSVLKHNETTNEDDAKINVRMGIHSGNVVEVSDINNNRNVAGEGINTAQRVMDCGDIGHLLLSDVAFRLRPAEPDRTDHCLPLGNVKVKHDQEVSLYSLSHGRIGNQNPPAKLLAEQQEAEARYAKIKAALDKEKATRDEQIRIGLEKAASIDRLRWLLTILVVVSLMAATYFISRAVQSPGPKATLYVYVFKPQSPQRYSSRAFSRGLTQDFTRSFRFLAPEKSPSQTSSAAPSARPSLQADWAEIIEVGKQMGVRYVLTGTVESDIENGDRAKLSDENPRFTVRVNVELYDTESKGRIPLKQYLATSFPELVTLEDSVLNDVCYTLHIAPVRSSDHDRKAKAHWDYLAGRFWAFQRANSQGQEKEEFTDRAKRYYRRAEESTEHPYDALALAGLADIKLTEGGRARDPKSSTNEALALLLKATKAAQRSGDEVAEPFASAGTEKWWLERDYLSAMIAFQLAIKLDPNLADIHKRYSSCLAVMGDEYAPEAQAQMDIALKMEPGSPVFQLASAQNHYFARRYRDAIGQLRILKENQANNNDRPDPAVYRFLFMAMERDGQGSEALEELLLVEQQNMIDTNDPDFLSVKAQILTRLGKRTEAVKIAEDLERRKESENKDRKLYVPPYAIAVIYAPMSDKKEKTLYWLERAKEEYDPQLNWVNVDGRFKEWQDSQDPRFTDPRFTAVREAVGFWRPPTDQVTAVNTARR